MERFAVHRVHSAYCALLRRLLLSLALLVGFASTPSLVAAQVSGLAGVVVDSAGRTIAGAKVTVREGGTRRDIGRRWESKSDSIGRFRIEGLVAGTLRLEVLRDAYEPAGFDIQIARGVVAEVRLRLVADEAWQLAKQAIDSITRADSITAARLRGRTSPVPVAAPVPAVASADLARSTGTAEVTLSQVITGALPPLAIASGPRRPGAPTNLLTGRVLTPSGEPVGRVQIQAMGTTILTLTDEAGRFALRDLAPGPYFVRARKVGFEPVVFTATLGVVDSLEASVRLTPLLGINANRLDTVRVSAEYDRMSRRLRGFEERRANIRGVFIDREEVAMRKPQLLSDLLRGRANITVQRNGVDDTQIFGTRISISSGYCPLALILDGTLINTNGGRMDNFVPVDMVAAIEVYTSGVSVPGQFARPETDCGAVIVWTR